MSVAFWTAVVVKLELYSMLALSLNLLVGYAGVVSLCHAAFWGVGAYGTALLMLRGGWDFLPATVGAVGLTVLLGWLVALPSLRLRDDYLIVATLAFQNIVYRILYNADGLTRGALGLMDLPAARFGPLTIDRDGPSLLLLATGLTLLVAWGLRRLLRSPFGLALRALRDDEVALQSLGRSPRALKVKAFGIGAAAAAVAGALLAARTTVLHPQDFTIEQSVLILTALIVGGCGNVRGPLVGALLLVTLEEVLRWVAGARAALAGDATALLLALVLLVVLRLRPRGLAGEYGFE